MIEATIYLLGVGIFIGMFKWSGITDNTESVASGFLWPITVPIAGTALVVFGLMIGFMYGCECLGKLLFKGRKS